MKGGEHACSRHYGARRPALVPFDDRPLTSNFSGRHSRVASCSSAEKHPCSSGGDYDIDPKAMPLLGWDERRGTAPLYHPMWRTTDHVPLCRLCTCFCSNKPYPLAHFKTPIALVVQVLAARTEGGGLHAATRLYGVSKNSIYRWQERLSGLKNTAVVCLAASVFTTAHCRR